MFWNSDGKYKAQRKKCLTERSEAHLRQITDMFKFWGGKLGCSGDLAGWEWKIVVVTALLLNIVNFAGLCV